MAPQHRSTPPTFSLRLNPQDATRTIPANLFGLNTEVTRRGVWQGLSAEMVANRKFAAMQNGFPKRWHVMGDASRITLDTTRGYAGAHSVVIAKSSCGRCPCGISQTETTLAFEAGRSYAIRLCLQSDCGSRVSMAVSNPASGERIFQHEWNVSKAGWQTFSEEFIPAQTCPQGGCLEIWTDSPSDFRIGAVSIQPADSPFGMRRDVVALLKELQPATLRYPGGCYAEFFCWKDSILPVDQRPPVGPTDLPFLLPENDDYDCCEIGLDDFLWLCQEVGAEPAVTVRMSEVTPQDAADLVEYCNGDATSTWGKRRAENGHAAPYHVKRWFLGNELWSFGRGGLNDASACAEATARFAKAMKAVDPSILLTGCSFYDNLPWNSALQRTAGNFLDEYSMHDYLFDHFKGELAAMAKAPETELKPLLINARNCLLQNIPNGHPLEIALDEWNLRWGSPGTIAMALYSAGVLALLCRDFEELRIFRAFYFMAINEGMVRVSPFTARLDTTGEIFKLMRPHGGSLLIPFTQSDDSYITYCASYNPAERIVHVTLINRNIAQTQTAEVKLDATTTATPARATCWIPLSPEKDADAFNLETATVRFDESAMASISLPPASVTQLEIPLK